MGAETALCSHSIAVRGVSVQPRTKAPSATFGEAMAKATFLRLLLCGVVTIAGTFAPLQPAEAGPVRVRFTPPYGAPFPNLYWFGEAVIDDGACTAAGPVSNLSGACAGEFTITSATVKFAHINNPADVVDINDPGVVLQTLHFTGGQVISVQRDTPEPPDWKQIVSTPFNTEQGGIPETLYDPDGAGGADPAQAYFSLIFVGGYAQLYWFQNDPGDPLLDPLGFPYVQWPNAAYYAGCYFAGPGDNKVGAPFFGIPYNHCGLSSNLEGNANGARLFGFVAAVPEPGTLALLLAAGLGALCLKTRRRNA